MTWWGWHFAISLQIAPISQTFWTFTIYRALLSLRWTRSRWAARPELAAWLACDVKQQFTQAIREVRPFDRAVVISI